MRLALRTLFWLVLAAAVAIGWGVEHWRAAARLAETKQRGARWSFGGMPTPTGPSVDAKNRQAKLAKPGALSDDELAAWLRDPGDEHFRGDGEYELGLSEMARRGMVEELQRRYDSLMEKWKSITDFPNNTKLLTALRRAQGRPDPLKIHVELRREDREGKSSTFPWVGATIENVDVGRGSVFLEEGGDYRSGRPERWRVQLVDRQGRRVPDSNFPSGGIGGGIGTLKTLAFGEKGTWNNLLDARNYVAPPSSGEYQLQLIHSDRYIADEPDLTGLLVFKSEPIDVIVTLPPLVGTISVVPLLIIVGIAALWSGLGIVRRLRRKPGDASSSVAPFSWRDAVAFVLVAGLAVGWWCDSRYMAGQIRAAQIDPDADWTMRLADGEEE